jgi:hypothetical protein
MDMKITNSNLLFDEIQSAFQMLRSGLHARRFIEANECRLSHHLWDNGNNQLLDARRNVRKCDVSPQTA